MIDKVDVPSAPTTAMNKSNLGIIAAKIPVISVYVSVKFHPPRFSSHLIIIFRTKHFSQREITFKKRNETKFTMALPSWLMSLQTFKLELFMELFAFPDRIN